MIQYILKCRLFERKHFNGDSYNREDVQKIAAPVRSTGERPSACRWSESACLQVNAFQVYETNYTVNGTNVVTGVVEL